MNASQRLVCASALVVMGAAQAQTVPAEQWVGAPIEQESSLSRAEVVADLNLWIRSGMSDAAAREDFDPRSAFFRSSVARYQNLRFGPAFAVELHKVQSPDLADKGSSTTAFASPSE